MPSWRVYVCAFGDDGTDLWHYERAETVVPDGDGEGTILRVAAGIEGALIEARHKIAAQAGGDLSEVPKSGP